MSSSESQKRYRAKIKAEGRCTSCKKDKEEPTKACCNSCIIKASERHNPNAWRARSERLQKLGLCVRCGEFTPKDDKKNCETCLLAESLRSRKIKFDVILVYGNKCECCEETILEFLTIDHINNDGASHRIKLFGKNKCGNRFYKWIIKNNFPKGLQVLCFNCNHGKFINGGVCPHKCGITQVV